MAREYYFEDFLRSGLCRYSAAETKAVGGAFARCVYDTLLEYSVWPRDDLRGPYPYFDFSPEKTTEKYKAFIKYYRNGRPIKYFPVANMDIDISVTERNCLLVDFKFDPLLPEHENDEIMAGIKAKAIEKKLIDKNEKIRATRKLGVLQAEKEWDFGSPPIVNPSRRML